MVNGHHGNGGRSHRAAVPHEAQHVRRGGASVAVAELGRLMKVIEKLAYVPKRMAVIAAPKLSALLLEQFTSGRDPYGRAWRPLKPSTLARGRRPPPLTDKKKLRDGTKATPGRAGIRLSVGASYGIFHQVGFHVGKTWVAPRRILPQFGMPATWKRALDESARQAVREARS